jgi:hypothetical protein
MVCSAAMHIEAVMGSDASRRSWMNGLGIASVLSAAVHGTPFEAEEADAAEDAVAHVDVAAQIQ